MPERTLCTYLGICRELGPDDVALDAIRDSKYIYVTGYLWDTDTQKEAVLLAMRTAKDSGRESVAQPLRPVLRESPQGRFSADRARVCGPAHRQR